MKTKNVMLAFALTACVACVISATSSADAAKGDLPGGVARLEAALSGPVAAAAVPGVGTVQTELADNAPALPPVNDGAPMLRPNHPPIDQIPSLDMPYPADPPPLRGPAQMMMHDAQAGETFTLPENASADVAPTKATNFVGVDGGAVDEEARGTRSFWDMYQITPTTAFPWRANTKLVMRFTNENGGTVWAGCSGTMIDAETVLTAGHCVYLHDEVDGPPINSWANEIWVYPARDGAVDPYGYGHATFYNAWTPWVNDSNLDFDVGAVHITRAVGVLTGWFSAAYGGDCDTCLARTYNNASYPGENCPDPGLHNGIDMYYWYGTFDSCPSNQLRMNTGGGHCFDTLWGGMSGGSAYYISGDSRIINAIASTSNRTTIGNYCKIWEGGANDINNVIIPSFRGDVFDLQALDANAEPATVYAGDALTLANFLATNPTNGSASGTWYLRLYLSTDDDINSSDTLLSAQQFDWDYVPMQSVRVDMLLPTIPAGTTPGDYWFGVELDPATDGNSSNNSTDGWDAVPITVLPARPANDYCSSATVIPSMVYEPAVYSTIGATSSISDPLQTCSFNGPNRNSNTVWYTYTPPCDGIVNISTCGSGYDTVLSVLTGTCRGLSEIGCNDDSGDCGSRAKITGLTVSGGQQLYIDVSDWNAPGGGDLDFSFEFIPGEIPANDECEDAISMWSVGYLAEFGTTDCSTFDDAPFCGTANTTAGVWYRVFGSGRSMIATTCNSNTDYDTKISVYCGTCGDFTCVGGNDDAVGAPAECDLNGANRKSRVAWCAQYGVEYLVLVHGFGGQTGDFLLEIYEDDVPCEDAVECGGSPIGACCGPDGGECLGGVCGAFESCGPAGTACWCAMTANGGGQCVSDIGCTTATPCPTGTECAPSEYCWVNSCCGRPICTSGCPGPQMFTDDGGLRASGYDASVEERGIPQPAVRCLDLTEAVCFAADGLYQGDFTSCAQIICPEPTDGACCVGGQCIGVTDELACIEQGGLWYAGEDCATITCPQYGACCLNGECIGTIMQPDCREAEGTWYAGEDCADPDFMCPEPPGACCLPEGRCIETSVEKCLVNNGTPLGPNTACQGDLNENGVDDACEPDLPCEDCGPGAHWVDECRRGDDSAPTSALIGIAFNDDCVEEITLRLSGPVHIKRSDPRDDSLLFPGLRPVDDHMDVIDTEMVSMELVGGGVVLTAGAGLGSGAVLQATYGAIAEDPLDKYLADSFFDVFFEIDLGPGGYAYNHRALTVGSKIDCVPPDATYIHPDECIKLFDSPFLGEGNVVAYLVRADHSTYPECGDPAAGSCFQPHNTPACDDPRCCEEVCAGLPHCCVSSWDDFCVAAAEEICPQPPQACCLPHGECLELTPDECRQHEGQSQGPGSHCTQKQACCLPDGTCQMLDPLCCEALRGMPMGPDEVCTGAVACCLEDGACKNLDPVCCEAYGGVPSAAGGQCTDEQACCFQDGTCAMLDPECCSMYGGIPQGANEVCTTPQGCCFPDGYCMNVDPLCCDDLGGVPQGEGEKCTREQACCLPDGTCLMLDPLCCQELNGKPQGEGEVCTFGQACCMPDGTCEMLDPLCCEAFGGLPQGPDAQCGQLIACCLPDGDCGMLDPLCCREAGGVPSPSGADACMGDHDGNGIDDACEFDEECECGPGPHWVDQCMAGVDYMSTGAKIGIDLDRDCRADTSLIMSGPVYVQRTNPMDDSMVFPGLRPINGHLEVMDTEMVSMQLTGGGLTLVAGYGFGQGGVLMPTLGAIAEQSTNNALADSFFKVYFEVDLGGGTYVYNHMALEVTSVIDCIPPNATYIHPDECIPLYNVPPQWPGQPVHIANLVSADHSTYPECGDPGTGDCFEPHDAPYCDDGTCCEMVCEALPRCCTDAWTPECVDYAAQVCRPIEACCFRDGSCDEMPPEDCQLQGGRPQGFGTRCLGDQNQNGIDDACEGGCPIPVERVEWIDPLHRTVDARQPRDVNDASILQGIRFIRVIAPRGADLDCWSFCETQQEGLPNAIVGVTDHGNDRYTIELLRRITPGAVSKVTYTDDGGSRHTGTFVSLPADSSADGVSNTADILSLIDCCLNAVCVPPWGIYSCDIDQSLVVNTADILRLIDLLNGAGQFTRRWNLASPHDNGECPD
ncbi:MAG: hypothetical protein JSU63_03395 [Phycisphaerales bacterium]|nr:MAG: hypothetical protein JSU63_03395 [Phycisphaerales bacterium]